MKEKIYVPHLLIAAKPPMRNPREMSSSGFVNLNHVIEVKRGHEPRGEVTKGLQLTTRTQPIQQ